MKGNGSSLKCTSPSLLYNSISVQYEKCIRQYNQPSEQAAEIGTELVTTHMLTVIV